MTMSLFDDLDDGGPRRVPLGEGAVVLRGFATARETALLSAVEAVIAAAPLRHMITPGGFRMSVAMTSCGALGWVTEPSGYRYDPRDPLDDRPWPPMPSALSTLAEDAAREAGFEAFAPDSCLVNRYAPGAKMSLHQDRNERDYSAPIVSVSLGIPAVFLLGGLKRSDPASRVRLCHGDVVVWGGPSRLRFHGVLPLEEATHRLVGGYRLNLTFRKAG